MLITFFTWLIEQQTLISLLLLTIIILERFCLKIINPSFVYKLVLVIPFAVIFSNLPVSVKLLQNNQFDYYLISLHPNYSSVASWEWAYAYVAVTMVLLAFIFISHMRFISKLDLHPIELKGPFKGNDTTATYVCSTIKTPMVIGIVKNKLALPTDYYKKFSVPSLILILEHESIHIKRKDNLSNTLFLLAAVLLWFNPLTWLAYGSFRRLQELSCDENVLRNKTTEQRILYSKALIRCATNQPGTLMAYSHYGDKNMIMQRLNNIKHNGQYSKIVKGGLLLVTACMLSTLAIANPAIQETSDTVRIEPILRVDPIYPDHAIEEGLSGSVVLKYDITSAGYTSNISVVSSTPKGVFNREAKKSLAKWLYSPSVQGHQNVMVQLDFAIDSKTTNTPIVEHI